MAGPRRLAAIMFTDTVGFTASMQANEAQALAILEQQQRILRPLFTAHRGREIKSTGDGFLVQFDSALRATQCALDIQRELHRRNALPGADPIRVRIGIHLGDVEERDADILGDAVNIAARIEPTAEPGGICVSGAVREQVWNKIPEKFEKLLPQQLKGLEVVQDVYRVVPPWTPVHEGAAASDRAKIAVLPLTNISPDAKDEYFADGLTEEVIGALSKIRELRVIARTSVAQYRSTSKTIAQIGSELGVSSILEGSVRKAGSRLRISLQLVDVSTQEHKWAQNYDRDLEDVFAIQSEVAEKTARALKLELLAHERSSIEARPTSNLVAYDLYLQGLHAARLFSEESIANLEGAIREDPSFSLPYSTLANYLIGISGDLLDPLKAFPRAKELIDRALELDPNSSDAHTALGNYALQHEQDWALAEGEFRCALSLNPSNAVAHHWYGVLLKSVRRFEEAKQEFRLAIELDPLWKAPKLLLGAVHYLSGDLGAALTVTEALREANPEWPSAHVLLGWCYADAGRLDDARNEVVRIEGPLPENNRYERAILSAFLGRSEEALLLTREVEAGSLAQYVNPTAIAELYSVLGEKEKALEWLERDYHTGNRTLWSDYLYRGFDAIRADPRFQSLLRRQNIPT